MAKSRKTDPETSHEAARAVPEGKYRSSIINHLQASGPDGLTTLEYADITGYRRESVSPIFRPLDRLGLIVDSGLTRLGHTGFRSIVWLHPDHVNESNVSPSRMNSTRLSGHIRKEDLQAIREAAEAEGVDVWSFIVNAAKSRIDLDH